LSGKIASLDNLPWLLDKSRSVDLGLFCHFEEKRHAVKYGVIGCGAIAQRRHIPECLANPDSVLIGIAEAQIRFAVMSWGKKFGVKSFCDHKDLLKMAEDRCGCCVRA